MFALGLLTLPRYRRHGCERENAGTAPWLLGLGPGVGIQRASTPAASAPAGSYA